MGGFVLPVQLSGLGPFWGWLNAAHRVSSSQGRLSARNSE